MKMLYSLHAYNKAKKVNCLINSWNIEGFKVFSLHRFSFSALLHISYGYVNKAENKRSFCTFSKCCAFQNSSSFEKLDCFANLPKGVNEPAQPEDVKGLSSSLKVNMQSLNSSFEKPSVAPTPSAQAIERKQNDEKIVNFSKKHKLFNKKLSYLSSPSSSIEGGTPAKELSAKFKPFADQEGRDRLTQGKGKAIEQSLILEEKKGFLDKSSNFQRKTTSDILNMRNTEQDSKLVQMEYSLETFQRSNQDTCLTHKPSVFEGTWVQSGDLLTDCASSVGGELSLGQNLLIAYMPWEGYNFEDAILISERLVRDDLYTSVHIERYELETLRPPKTSAESKQQTKLGAEEITRNIPDVSEKEIQKLDSYGIIKRGSWVEEGDILVGKITPINKKTISPYQKLLYTILEKQVKPIKDSSLRAPKGIKAKVVDIKYFLRKNPMRNLTKSSTSQSSKTLVKQEFDKKNKQSLKRQKTLVNSSTVRLLGMQKSRFFKQKLDIFYKVKNVSFCLTNRRVLTNRQFWKSAFLLYKQRMDHNKKFDFVLLNFFKKFKKTKLRSTPCRKRELQGFELKGVQALRQKTSLFRASLKNPAPSRTRTRTDRTRTRTRTFGAIGAIGAIGARAIGAIGAYATPSPSAQASPKAQKEVAQALFFDNAQKNRIKRNKTYLNFFYKIQTLASLPLLKQRKSLIVLNSFLPFLQRLKKKYKILLQSPLSHRRCERGEAQASLFDKSKIATHQRCEKAIDRKAKSFFEQEKEQYIIKGKHFVKPNSISAPLSPLRLALLLQKPSVLSLTYASGKKRKGYSKSCAFAFGGASLAPSYFASPSESRKAQLYKKTPFFEKVQKPSVFIKKQSFLKSPKKNDVFFERARKSEIIQNIETIHIYLAEKRKVQVGDKMAGRHGNKGIVSQILPIQDMPYLPDGTPIDMVLNPLGVPSRMNVGQIYECLLGLAGKYLGENYKIPSFDEAYGADASRSFVFNKLFQARMQTGANWLFDPNSPGKMRLYDGRNGECFLQPVTVGQAYILRLVHMVDDKIHMRSTGPYSLVTQQPLRGRSKQGGQRLGEMEVWALEGYGAAFTLLEMLTIKSDDMTGRMTLWSNLILNKDIAIGTPESFKVLVCELQALCLDIGLFRYSQPMSHAPSATSQLSAPGGSEAAKQGNGTDFNKFSLREINSLINLP